MLSGRF